MVDTQTLGDQSELSTAINEVSLEHFCFGFLNSKWRLYPPIGIFVILLYYKWKCLAHSRSSQKFFSLTLRFSLFPVFKILAPKHWVFKLYMLLISSTYLFVSVDLRPVGSSCSSSWYLIQFVHQKLWIQNLHKSNRFSFENLRNTDKLWVTLFFLVPSY